MRHPIDSVRHPWLRRVVLGAAIVLGLAVALPGTHHAVDATTLVIAQAVAASADTPPATPAAPAAPKAGVPADEPDEPTATPGRDPSSEITIDHRGITVQKGGKRVNVHGFGADREYDSFQDFVNDSPWLAAIVFLTVLMVFLTPLLIVSLLIWYKIRKTRMQNDTLLKLAEKGVVPPAEALQAISSGNPAASPSIVNAAPVGSPLYEEANALRKRAAWSDLRKGVVMGAIGLGLTMHAQIHEGTPGRVGLILLFVGIGYVALWWFEQRQVMPSNKGRDDGGPGSL